MCEEVQYLGHVITPSGLRTNSRLVSAVTKFPCPKNVSEVRRFIRLSSYYRQFIRAFSKTAQPLHNLTRKGVDFHWSVECQKAFEKLKEKVVSAYVLMYPSFVLETDASGVGIGAVLSQPQEDGKLHPVAYASRSLTPGE